MADRKRVKTTAGEEDPMSEVDNGNSVPVAHVLTPRDSRVLAHPTHTTCRWCDAPIMPAKPGQKFCSSQHRYSWHRAQRISPAKFEEKVRAIVREEIERLGLMSA